MAERQTIIERVARFAMELVGAEEVEARIEKVDETFLRMAARMQNNIKIMHELSAAFRSIGKTMSGTVLQQLPQTTKFLEQYIIAGERAEATGQELTLSMYAQSEEGQKLATSLGLVVPKLEKTATTTEKLKQKFWELNSIARGLLRVFVAFKIVAGLVRVFSEWVRANIELEAEMRRLHATIDGVNQEVDGAIGVWEEWADTFIQIRQALPHASLQEIAKGLRTIVAIAGPLGLVREQIAGITILMGQMAAIVGQEVEPFIRQMITAVTGTGRAVAALNIDLRDGSAGLTEFAENLGVAWDELDQTGRTAVRLAYFLDVASKRTEDFSEVIEDTWFQLIILEKAQRDTTAAIGEMINWQVLIQKVKLTFTQAIGIMIHYLGQLGAHILAVTGALAGFLNAWMTMKAEFTIWDVLEKNEAALESWNEKFEEGREKVRGWVDFIKEYNLGLGEVDEATIESVTSLEELIKYLAEVAKAHEGGADSAEEFGSAITRAYQQARNALRSYQQAVEQAGINLARRLADIARNLEERLMDLESRFEARRDQLIRRFEERRTGIREDAAEKEEELRKDLNKRLRRMEEDHRNEMQELREDYLIDLEEAARKLDAVSMRRIQQRYILEKKQRERDYNINRRRAIEDYKDQLDELRKAREEQERELEESLERQLRELQENYERQQEEARLNAERQREDALRNYQEQLDDLWRNFQDRLEAIVVNLMEEEEEYEGTYRKLRDFFDEWYQDDLEKMWLWLEERRKLLEAAGAIDPRPPIPYPRPPWRPGPRMAMGGIGIARSTTQVTVGDAGPEIFAAWPLGQRMPRLGADIRLTIDGTQAGAWSADFENQTLRILREVLQEVV